MWRNGAVESRPVTIPATQRAVHRPHLRRGCTARVCAARGRREGDAGSSFPGSLLRPAYSGQRQFRRSDVIHIFGSRARVGEKVASDNSLLVNERGRSGALVSRPRLTLCYVQVARLDYTRLYSLRFNCKIVSFTAAKTNLMFSVSVACV